MVIVPGVECVHCGTKFMVLEKEKRVESEKDTEGKIGATGIAEGKGGRKNRDEEYIKEEVLVCQCPNCGEMKRFYEPIEEGEENGDN